MLSLKEAQLSFSDSQINQHGWTKIFNISATTKDENSLLRQIFVGHFRINRHALTAQQTMKINKLRQKHCVI